MGTHRVGGMEWLLLSCALWSLRPTRAQTQHSSEQSDWGGYDNRRAQGRIPWIHMHGGLGFCAPKPGQDCGPGFYRVRTGPYHIDCAPCECNGLSECEDGTGRCRNCQYNTAGDHCERCKEGYHGNAIQRTCTVCPCPYAILSNSFATGCMEHNNSFKCVCKPGYTGPRCERCAPGFYGDPLAFGNTCEPCNCDNGNPNTCDSRTGECIRFLRPGELHPGDHCQDCDSCVQALLEYLEGMDIELAWLKTQLKHPSIGPVAQGLEKLEEAIAPIQDLVRKYKNSLKSQGSTVKELQADVGTLHADLSQLGEKANRTLLNAQREHEKTGKTYDKAEHLVSNARLLFLSIQGLLEQLKLANPSGSMADTKKLSQAVKEAQMIVQKMKQHDCSAQKEAADREWKESSKLLNNIKNDISKLLVSNQGVVDRIADLLNMSMSKLNDLEVALKEVNGIVGKTTLQNSQNLPMLKAIQNRVKELGELRNLVTGQIAVAMDQLKGSTVLQKMLRDLKTGYERLIAQFDGARTDLIKKVNAVSQAAAKEPIVLRAEEYAKELDQLSWQLQALVKDTANTSGVRQALNATGIYKNITDAVAAAKEAAGLAKEAADKALSDVKGKDFLKKAKGLKDQAERLMTEAKDTQNEHEKSADKKAAQSKRLAQARSKAEKLLQELLLAQKNLGKIGRDDIGAILDTAKANVVTANNRINTTRDAIDYISDRLGKMNASAPDLNSDNFLKDLDKTVSNLTAAVPSLLGLLDRTEADSHLLPQRNNVTQSIRRIKELIREARDAANRISVPVDFSGDGFVELRPPSDLEDLRAYTNLVFSLQRPVLPARTRRQKPAGTGNMFVLYLGNKDSSKDYIGVALRDNVLHCVYKLGGAEHHVKSGHITESPAEAAFFDRVNLHRIYQDVEVNLTKSFTSSNPHPPQSSSSQPGSLGTLLDLHPGEVVFYVGGYPDRIFTPPASLRDHEKYTGCIEFSSFNDRFISLYNFKNVSNINGKTPCGRYSPGHISRYFEGTGYARGTIKKQQDVYVFFQLVLSHSENAMLFYLGNEESYYSVVVEKGYIVLRWRFGNTVMEAKSPKKEFPLTTSKEIQVVLLGNAKKILVRVTGRDVITSKYTRGVYDSYYIGGLAPSLRERYNITAPPFKGCMTNIKFDNIVVKFEDEVGVGPGCSTDFLAIRESTFGLGGSLSAPPRGFKLTTDLTVSLGFRSTENGGILLKNSQERTGIELSLVDGFVVFKLNNKALKSRQKYKDGKWHYLTIEKRGSRLEMRVDEEDLGQVQSLSSSVPAKGQDVWLGNGTFQGCLTNLYMRRAGALYKPEDLSAFRSTGDVTVGLCAPEQFTGANCNKRQARSARKREVWQGVTAAKCGLPSAVGRAHRLESPTSHLSYNISPQVLNHRPHFSLAFRTRSAGGLLLFVGGKRGHCHVALYMTKGRIELSVGGNQALVHNEKCNDGKWHRIMLSLEMHTFHLVVDHHRALDGVISCTNGFSLELQPPVYLGSLPQSMHTESQMLFPRDSVVGCIKNFKMNSRWIEELPTNHGAPLCFDGNTERGTYFSGNGAYAVLDCPNRNFMGVGFHLEFEVQPRNLTGALLHINDQHHSLLALFMKKGEVVLQMSGVAGVASVSVRREGLCDARFHHVAVSRKKTGVQLTVDHKSVSMRVPSLSGKASECHLYAGGVPDTLQNHRLPVKTSFIGCIRNLQINGESIALCDTSQVFGPVNLWECPSN